MGSAGTADSAKAIGVGIATGWGNIDVWAVLVAAVWTIPTVLIVLSYSEIGLGLAVLILPSWTGAS